MSQFMWNRIHRLKIQVPPEVNKEDVDRAFETETGKDCDRAAKELSDKDFKRMMEKAFRRLLEKKPMIAYA